MSFMPRNLTGVPILGGNGNWDLVRGDYDRSYPGDSREDLMRRARFDKHDKGLLREWLALAAEREMESTVTYRIDSSR